MLAPGENRLTLLAKLLHYLALYDQSTDLAHYLPTMADDELQSERTQSRNEIRAFADAIKRQYGKIDVEVEKTLRWIADGDYGSANTYLQTQMTQTRQQIGK